MSVRRMGLGSPAVTAQTSTDNLSIHAAHAKVSKNGIEFRSEREIATWTEMTLEFFSPFHDRKLQCSGVVVACTGNRHQGFVVSMIFTNISQTTLDILTQLHPPQSGN